MKANDKQHGGSHYKDKIQVWDFVSQNDIPYLEGNVIKYVARHKRKNGIEDLHKAKHYLEKLIENAQHEAEDFKIARMRKIAGNSEEEQHDLEIGACKGRDGC